MVVAEPEVVLQEEEGASPLVEEGASPLVVEEASSLEEEEEEEEEHSSQPAGTDQGKECFELETPEVFRPLG